MAKAPKGHTAPESTMPDLSRCGECNEPAEWRCWGPEGYPAMRCEGPTCSMRLPWSPA